MKSPSIEIRRLLPTDLDPYFANRLRALANAPSAFLTTLAEEQARGNGFFAKTLAHTGPEKAIFGALVDGHLAGVVGIFQEERPKTRHKSGIWGMYVDVDHREKGLGGKLLDMAIHFAKAEMGVAAVFLSVESNNRSARRLYESRGFRCWGTEPMAMSENGRHFDEDHMVLKL